MSILLVKVDLSSYQVKVSLKMVYCVIGRETACRNYKYT